MWRVRRIELEVVEHRPAEHVGQEDVERDRGRAILARERERLLAAVGDDALEALVARDPEQDARVVRIVLDDQQDGVARADLVAIVGDRLLGLGDGEHRHCGALRRRGRAPELTAARRAGVGERQVQRERAALARLAAEADLAAEQGRELAADREAEAGAAVLAARAGVGLLERLEDQLLLLGRDADAGVGDHERDRRAGRARAPGDRASSRRSRAARSSTRSPAP